MGVFNPHARKPPPGARRFPGLWRPGTRSYIYKYTTGNKLQSQKQLSTMNGWLNIVNNEGINLFVFIIKTVPPKTYYPSWKTNNYPISSYPPLRQTITLYPTPSLHTWRHPISYTLLKRRKVGVFNPHARKLPPGARRFPGLWRLGTRSYIYKYATGMKLQPQNLLSTITTNNYPISSTFTITTNNYPISSYPPWTTDNYPISHTLLEYMTITHIPHPP